MDKGADLSRAILYSVSGGVLIAAFGLLGTPQAQAEPKNTAGTSSAPAKTAGDAHGSSANAAEHRQEKQEWRKASGQSSGSHSSSSNSAERRQQKADEKKSGRSNSGSSANAAEHRQQKEDKRQAERRQRDYAESQRGGSPGSGLRRQIDSAREKGQKAEVDRLEKRRNAQREQRQREYQQYVPAWKAYAESQRGGAPGTGLKRQLDAAREKADRLAVGPGAASTGDAALVRRGREAAAALAEVRRLEQQQERHAQRRQAELDEQLRETRKYAAAWSAYGESQRGGAPGTADKRRKLAEQARIAQGQLDYIDATRGKEAGGRTAQVVERLPDGRLRVTDAKSLQSAVVETKDFLHPPASVEAEFVTAPDKEVVAERRKLEVRDWQKLPGGQHPGVSVGSTEDGKLVAVSRGALPADVAAKLRDGWVVERGTSTADGREVTVFHPRTRFQDNFEDLEQQWQRAFRDRRVDLPQVGRALAGSAALAVDGHVLGQGNLYGTGKDCIGSGKNCDALLGESALTAANAFPVGRLGRIGRIVEETGGAGGVFKGTRGAKYEASPKHGTTQRGNAAPAPTNGQDVLERSVQVKDTSARRVGADPETGEFVVFDETLPGQGVFHGHTRSWDELTDQMRNALRRAGVVNARGKITGG